MRVGVLALQGAFAEHIAVLRALGHDTTQVRLPRDLEDVDALVLPGGESTTQRKLIDRVGLAGPLDEFVRSGAPILATCAGLILASDAHFGWIDVTVQRNGWGRQIDSFQVTDDTGELELVFIRAPRIVRVGPSVEVLVAYQGEPVMVRQGGVVAATFHPELVRGNLHERLFARQVSRRPRS